MRMPTCLVLTLLTMQPRLEAEESITAANRVAIGGGKLKKEHATPIVEAWHKAAQPKGARRKVDPGALAVAGFAVRRVKYQRKKT